MVFKMIWLSHLEAWLTLRLLRSPVFHRMVGRVHQHVQHIRHGVPLDESRTTLDNRGPVMKKFVQYFTEELKDQMKGKPPNKL
ncbi:hypothetical protein N7492_008660 [Penicillium capsulatum]|uniref:Uncharacterized protein n=1 Tax=Penicillium capsulatum TaxID=69766 RepID=A0A9W9HSE2_9EURO|nr:hypothetical protein N7492_008660 [Penicillium capsulatum]KAJ6106064.1 hypothetical protein N7512_009581 [Penicillium capsulatum]